MNKDRPAANYAHQMELFNPACAKPIIVIGVGSIGGYVVDFLAKMGVSDITVMDHDSVASHNSPMSIYRPQDVGRHKVDVLKEIVYDHSGISIKTFREEYTNQKLDQFNAVIVCVDEMAVRKAIWDQVKGNIKISVHIDTRTSGAYGEIISTSPFTQTEQADYEKLLYSDEEASIQTCGMHGVIYASVGVAAGVTGNIAQHWQNGNKKPRDARRYDLLKSIF